MPHEALRRLRVDKAARSSQLRADNNGIEFETTETDTIWELIPLSGSTTEVITAARDGTQIGDNGKEVLGASKGERDMAQHANPWAQLSHSHSETST